MPVCSSRLTPHAPRASDRLATGHRLALLEAQRQSVARLIVGLMPGMRFGTETRRVNIRTRAREQHTVDGLQQRADIRDIRGPGEHQRQRHCRPGDHVAVRQEAERQGIEGQ